MTPAPDRAVTPYGAWASPFAIELLTRDTIRLSEPRAIDGAIWWLEGRPDDGGRNTLVRRDPDGTVHDVSPAGMNVRDRVQEYGGAPYAVHGDLVVVSSFADGRLYRVGPDRSGMPITPAGAWRYADLVVDPSRDRMLAVREDHASPGEAVTTLVEVALDGGEPQVIRSGADFYAAPRLSPDGRSLAWLEWDHPNLPWDGTSLLVAEVTPDGTLGDAHRIAGGPSDWIAQPRWSAGGVLHFVAEPDGWMNLQRLVDGRTESLAPTAAEFASPDWVFGEADYAIAPDGTICAAARSGGRDHLYRVAPGGGASEIAGPYTELDWLSLDGERVVALASSPTSTSAIVRIDPGTGRAEVLRQGTTWQPDPHDLSVGESIDFASTDGRIAHGIFYPPHNRRVRAPDSELPPLIVTSHGGPTAQASTALSVTVQLFTSRGIAVLDVDYGGSTGYGREYRRSLEGRWGIVDVDDCVAGARWLAERRLVDGDRMAIRGGSASGYTTLAALAFRDEFAAGISYFGIGDLAGFARETHKFESRYLERLVGPWPAAAATYAERSPSMHADLMTAPVLVLQGLDDRVVPPSEAERIVDALWERRIAHAYLAFEGEDHGFRQASSILRSMEAELSFLGQVFGFVPADPIEPLAIEHLDGASSRRAPADRSPAPG